MQAIKAKPVKALQPYWGEGRTCAESKGNSESIDGQTVYETEYLPPPQPQTLSMLHAHFESSCTTSTQLSQLPSIKRP